ncbi:uncharacterized protein [Physcomitrium patens]|uniref:uncharacterized protein isoform X1 n=1 Tax=Physcomitrium patens TaxID=3218 RepID=UPI003CCD93FD
MIDTLAMIILVHCDDFSAYHQGQEIRMSTVVHGIRCVTSDPGWAGSGGGNGSEKAEGREGGRRGLRRTPILMLEWSSLSRGAVLQGVTECQGYGSTLHSLEWSAHGNGHGAWKTAAYVAENVASG